MSPPESAPAVLPSSPLAAESLARLPALLCHAEEPRAAVLDLLLELLALRSIVLVEAGASRGGAALGRRPPGRPIPRPERLMRAGVLERLLAAGGPLHLAIGGGRSGWVLGCPVPLLGELRAAILAERAAPPEAPGGAPALPLLASAAPWVELALRLCDLRRGPPPEGPALGTRPGREPRDGPRPPVGAGPTPPVGWSPDRTAPGFPGIVAASPAMREVLRTVSLIADSSAAVLIEGESGTGKELVARAVHGNSPRARGPFVCENCAACPEGLLESEFFGVERGAFTGASRTKPGLFERASGGTLFLDEIGDMDLGLQRKLLRALQEREVRRVGGSTAIPVDFRLISATNRVLAEEARAGRFRADLLYRIDVVSVRIPPLRERREDIPSLARHLIDRHARTSGLPPPPVDAEALDLLCSYPWPGNVRELENELWRAVALRVPVVTPEVLSPKIRRGREEARLPFRPRLALGRSLDEIERDLLGELIRDALRQTGGNKIRAAQLLGIPKTSLYRRLRRYRISEFSRTGGIP